MNLLAIETATEACSVAMIPGQDIIARSEIAPRRHTADRTDDTHNNRS